MKTHLPALCSGSRTLAVLALGVLLTAPIAAYAGLTVTASNDAATLVSTILGAGITVVPGSETYTGANTNPGSSGSFSGGNSIGGAGLGINAGLIMTSGNAIGAIGPNNQDGYSGAGAATSLAFDFTSTGGNLYFNYVFASEEYNEYTNSQFNDRFEFRLDGTNIALIPGTSTPVSINNVNGGNPFGTNASHPEFYHNNDLQDGGPFYNIQYDGFTSVFTASALNLTPGTHHIQLFITDIGDSILDSAVFIQGNSFSDNPTPPDDNVVPDAASTSSLLLAGLTVVAVLRRRFC